MLVNIRVDSSYTIYLFLEKVTKRKIRYMHKYRKSARTAMRNNPHPHSVAIKLVPYVMYPYFSVNVLYYAHQATCAFPVLFIPHLQQYLS